MTQHQSGLWVISPEEKSKHEAVFNSLKPNNGKISGDQAKKYFLMSNLPTPVLGQIWNLSDIDNDGRMTLQEFTIAMHLIQVKLRGVEIPKVLPNSLKSSSVQTKSVFDTGFSNTLQQGLMMPSTMPISNGTPGGSIMQPTNFSLISNKSSGYSGGVTGFAGKPQMMQSSAFGTGSFPSNTSKSTSAFSSLGDLNSLTSWGSGLNPQATNTKQQTKIGWGQPQRSVYSSSMSTNQNTALNITGSLNIGSILPVASQSSSFSPIGINQISIPNEPNIAGRISPISQQPVANFVSPNNRLKYAQIFKSADPEKTGFIQGERARQLLIQSNVPPQTLRQIWDMSDMNKDGNFDLDEFIIAMHLIELVKSGKPLPSSVPQELIKFQQVEVESKGEIKRSDSLTRGRSGSNKNIDISPATFEDRKKLNFEKGRMELERRRKELQDKQAREKEEIERKEREEEERKRRAKEEAEHRRQQELENERRQREEMEKEQEALKKKMIEQRQTAQLEAEKQRQREWERRRKEELLNQKGLEQVIVTGLKTRLDKLKMELQLENQKHEQLTGTVQSKRSALTDLTNTVSRINLSRDSHLAGINSLQIDIKESKSRFDTLKQERERLHVEVNKMDSTTTSEAFGGVRSNIQQMRSGFIRLKNSITAMEAEYFNSRKEANMLNVQLPELKTSLQIKTDENIRLKQLQGQKRREYLIVKHRAEEETRRIETINRQKKEDEERQKRNAEAQRKKEEQRRKFEEDQVKKQREKEMEAMIKEQKRREETMRRIKEAQESENRRRIDGAKRAAEEYLKKEQDVKQQQSLKVQDELVQQQQDALISITPQPLFPPPRKITRPETPQPFLPPPRKMTGPEQMLQEILMTNIQPDRKKGGILPPPGKDKKPVAPPRPKQGPVLLKAPLPEKASQSSKWKDLEVLDTARREHEDSERKQREEDNKRRKKEQEVLMKKEEEQRLLEEQKRKQEEARWKKEEELRYKEERRLQEEEVTYKMDLQYEDGGQRQLGEVQWNEEETKRKEESRRMEAEAGKPNEQDEVKRRLEEMKRTRLEKKQQQEQEQQTLPKPKVALIPPKRPPGPASKKQTFANYKILFPFSPRNPDELELLEGDVIKVDESDTSAPPGWIRGTSKGKSGLFPANYGEKLPAETFCDYVDLDPKATVQQQNQQETVLPKSIAKSEEIVAKPLPKPAPKPLPKPVAKPLPKPTAKPLPKAPSKAVAQPDTQPELQSTVMPDKPPQTTKPISMTKPVAQPRSKGLPALPAFGSISNASSTSDSSDSQKEFEVEDFYAVPNTGSANFEAQVTTQLTHADVVKDIDEPKQSYENAQLPSSSDGPLMSETILNAPDGLQVIALYPHRGKKQDHLSFNKNEIIIVQKQQDMWWYGECNGKNGWFPKSYVKIFGTLKTTSIVQEDKQVDDTCSVTSSTSSVTTEHSVGEQTILAECIALFDYTGQEGDLIFKENDLIQITKMDGEWWEGICNGESGLFPANYVEIKEQEAPKKKPEVASVILPFTSTDSTQLSLNTGQLIHVLQKDASGWWKGELQARGKKRQVGWFPANHVKLLGAVKMSETAASSISVNDNIVSEDLYAVPNKLQMPVEKCEQVLAIFSYTAQNDDELTFYKGSVINVISREGDWWKGELNGQVGMFPNNYVQLLSDMPDTTDQWEGSFDTHVLNAMTKTQRMRQNHIYELIQTEQLYMDDLSSTLEVFYNPIAEANVLSVQQLNLVFVNWKELIMCNMKLMKALLVRKTMSTDNKIDSIGDILVEQIPHLTPYIRFCSCQLKACKFLQNKVETDVEFKYFEKKCAGDAKLRQNLPLSSYLLKPLQRITKYPLIIKQILKYTPEQHYDRENLEMALEKAEGLCTQINESLRLAENTDRLEWLQNHVELEGLGEKLIFNSQTNCLGQRKIIHHGTLYKHKSNKELKVFLFNDFLLLCRQQTSHFGSTKPIGTIFIDRDSESDVVLTIYKKPIFLNEIVIKMPMDSEVNETLFHLSHIDRIYSLRTEMKNERNTWVSKLQSASDDFIDTERLQRQNAHRARSVRGDGVGRLTVTIIEGADLQASDPTGTSDPYCEVSMGSQEHKTKVIPKTLNPKWNSSMVFTIKDIKQDVLCITVFDRDFFSPNDFLGRTEVSLASLMRQGKGPMTKRLLLHEVSTGEIAVKFEIQKFQTR